ncbi:MAG: AAA family ATPase, partial [Limisphaerales bacterium]
PGPVLYLNFEIQDYAWHMRFLSLLGAKGIELRHGAMKLWNLRGKASDFQTILPRISQQARDLGFALIILDPIYKLYGRTDENKAGDVAALLNGLEALAVETGSAIAFGAHFSKGNQAGKESMDRISGSGVFARDPDSILIFTKHEQEDAFTVEATLRNFAPVDPFVVRWDFPLMRPDATLDPSKLKQAGGRKKDHTAEDLLDVLGDQSMKTGEWLTTAKTETGMSERTFYSLLRELQKQDRVLKSKINTKWQRVSK